MTGEPGLGRLRCRRAAAEAFQVIAYDDRVDRGLGSAAAEQLDKLDLWPARNTLRSTSHGKQSRASALISNEAGGRGSRRRTAGMAMGALAA